MIDKCKELGIILKIDTEEYTSDAKLRGFATKHVEDVEI